jgi:hypothetical protein
LKDLDERRNFNLKLEEELMRTRIRKDDLVIISFTQKKIAYTKLYKIMI